MLRTPTELSHPVYHDEEAARKHLEAVQWPDGPNCPYCGVIDQVKALGGKSMGPGWYHCGACRKKFTVRVGTVFERSHIPLHKWLLAFRLFASSKKGFSAHQLHRTLDITYKSAWFVEHRIREAMREDVLPPMGGKGKIVEADETYIGPGNDIFVSGRGWQKQRGPSGKRKVISLVERGGRSRSFKVENIDAKTARKILDENVSKQTRIHTDEAHIYKKPAKDFAAHESVNHSKEEYARGDVTTNSVEGFFSIFKRGMTGVYQHCGEQHLQRYLDEFDFRYSNRAALGIEDSERTTLALKGAKGKRLLYRNPNRHSAA